MGIKAPPFIRKETFKREDCLFFDELLTMMTALSSYLIAAQLVQTKESPIIQYPEDQLVKKMRLPFPSKVFNELYVYDLYTPLKAIAANQTAFQIDFDVHETLDYDIETREDIHFVEQPYSFNQRIIGSALISFYENKLEEIKSKFGQNTMNWPDVINFIRVIRNAFAHGGEIHFTNPNAASVHWKSLIYSPLDNGKSIYNEIFVVEIIELMRELENQTK